MHPETFYETKADGTIDTVFRNLKFTYLCYYVDFVFYKTKRWQLSVPIQAGTGLAWWQKQSKLNFYSGDKKHFFILYVLDSNEYLMAFVNECQLRFV